MLPLSGTSCLVYGSGALSPSIVEMIGRDPTRHLVVAVNGAPQTHSIAPDVLLYIDPGDWASSPSKALHVHSSSVDGPNISLPTWRVKQIPMWTNPGRLYHVPNSAAVAAVWAMSVGCKLVGMVGCGCEDDGRGEHQLRTMRQVRDDVIATFDGVCLIETFGQWMAFQGAARAPKHRIYFDPATRLRTFYR